MAVGPAGQPGSVSPDSPLDCPRLILDDPAPESPNDTPFPNFVSSVACGAYLNSDSAIRVGTDCSGMEAPIQALRNLGIAFKHEFSSDTDPACRATISENFPPVSYTKISQSGTILWPQKLICILQVFRANPFPQPARWKVLWTPKAEVL